MGTQLDGNVGKSVSTERMTGQMHPRVPGEDPTLSWDAPGLLCPAGEGQAPEGGRGTALLWGK